ANQMIENQQQRQRREQRGRVRERDHDMVHDATTPERAARARGELLAIRAADAASRRDRRRGHQALPPARPVCHTSQRAIPLTTIVTTSSAAPIAISADTCMSLVASLNSFAITDAI